MRGIPFLAQRPILRFFLLTALSFVLMTAGWRFVADYASRPAAFISRVMLEMNFSSSWLDSTKQGPHQLVVNTRVAVPFTPQQLAQAKASGLVIPPGAVAEAVLEVDPARYGYGLPILLALLLAAHSGRFFRKAAIGALLLIPFQAFTISMVLLKDLAFRSGAGGETFTQFQLEMIAYGYQLGTLLVPTVAPIVIWLWLDNKYVTTVLFDGWFDKKAGKTATPAGPAAPDAPAATQQALAAPDVPAATSPGETVPKA
mgnify:FL=1